MDRNQLKKIIEEEAKKVLAESGINVAEDITPEQIKKLAEECKKINSSLDFRSPIINDEKFLAESVIKTEDARWKRLVEYKTFQEDSINENHESNTPSSPEDFFDYVVSHNGLNESLEEAFLGNITKAALPFVLAGYLSIFGGNMNDAVAQFEKETKTKATTEIIEKSKEVAKEKGVNLGSTNDATKGNPNSNIKFTETSKEGDVAKYDDNGYPIYLKGTPSHSAWKSAFDNAKSTFLNWKSGLSEKGIDFKTQNPSEVDSHLSYKEIKGKLYLVYHYDGNNLDYYLDLGPAPTPKPEPTPEIGKDTMTYDNIEPHDDIEVDDLKDKITQIKGNKQKFSMNVGVNTHYTTDAAGNKVAHKTGDIINGEKITFPDGTGIMMDQKGTFYDVTNPEDIKKIDPSGEYAKYDLMGANKIAPSDKKVIKSYIKSARNGK